MERHAIPHRTPVEPSQSVKDAHSLAHEPHRHGVHFAFLIEPSRMATNSKLMKLQVTTFYHLISSTAHGLRRNLTSLRYWLQVGSDRHARLCAAIPTLQKGGKSLSYLVTELNRFILYYAHSEIVLRCDKNPALLLYLRSCQTSLHFLEDHS